MTTRESNSSSDGPENFLKGEREWQPLEACIAEMRHASELVDDAYGTSDYQTRLVALALIARHFLRQLDSLPPPPKEPAK